MACVCLSFTVLEIRGEFIYFTPPPWNFICQEPRHFLTMLALSVHAATGATAQLPSIDAKCTGSSHYVHSSTYSARVSTWGQVGRGGWRGAVRGPNGKIYGIPTNATSVLELDPATRKVETFGDLGTASTNCSGTLHCGLDKWSTTRRRLRLEPSTSRPAHPTTHASEPHRGTVGGVLAPTGKIIGIPCALRPTLRHRQPFWRSPHCRLAVWQMRRRASSRLTH